MNNDSLGERALPRSFLACVVQAIRSGLAMGRRALQPARPRRRYPVTGHRNPFVVRRALLRQAMLELKRQPLGSSATRC